MAVSQRDWRLIAVFLFIMAIAYLVLSSLREPEASLRDISTVPPSVFITQAHVDNFSEESGSLDWRLTSPNVRYFDSTRLLVADDPILTVHENRPTAPWIIRAGRAAIYRDEELVRLNQGVTMDQTAREGHRKIETARIDYYPNRQFAEAIYPVVVDSETVSTRGDRMKFWLDREYFELNGNVVTKYETNH